MANFIELKKLLKPIFWTREGNNTANGHIYAGEDGVYDVGSNSVKFRTVYADSFVGTVSAADELVGAEAGDTPGYLSDKLDAGSRISLTVIGTTDKQVQIAVDSTGLLLRDGTNSLTGNLTVAGGITIDGVDISAHAADVNAHHNRDHVLASAAGLGSTHTVSGLTSGQVLQATGATTALFAALSHTALTGVTDSQHHNPVTSANTGIAVTASPLQVVTLTLNSSATSLEISSGLRIADAIAGSGLIINGTTKVLAVGAGDGIDVNADDVAVDVTDIVDTSKGIAEYATNNIGVAIKSPDSGLAFDGTGPLRLGTTPGTLSVSETARLSGDTHYHPITSSNNPGAAASILATGASGNLTLRRLTVDGDDFDVVSGSTLIFKVNIADTNVGIFREPDSQFSLDVAGALRADFIVGKLAVQLSGALLISHFDGPGPFSWNKTGEFNGHAGQVGTPTPYNTTTGEILRITSGLFGGGLQMYGGTYSNLETSNPEFDGNSTTGWSGFGTATGTRFLTSSDAYSGLASEQTAYSYYNEKTGGTNAANYGVSKTVTLTATGTHKVTIRVKILSIVGGTQQVTFDVSAGTATLSANATQTIVVEDDPHYFSGYYPTNEWIEMAATINCTATGTIVCDIYLDQCTTGIMLVDALMVAKMTIFRPYTATSKTTAASLTYSLKVDPRLMTFFAYVKLSDLASTAAGDLYVTELYDGTNSYKLYIDDADDKLKFADSSGVVATSTETVDITTRSALPEAEQYVLCGFTISYKTVKVYLFKWEHQDDGTGTDERIVSYSENSGTLTTWIGSSITAYVGSDRTPSNRINGIIDEYVITQKRESLSRFRTIFESQAPVFAESSVFSFRATPQGLVWADSNGLWVKAALTGDAVFGVYANSSTHSWGNVSMSQGDILMGHKGSGSPTKGAWMYFNQDGVSSLGSWEFGFDTTTTIRFDATGSYFAGVMNIDTNGEIRQGTGTLGSSTFIGLRIWNSGGVGLIAGYNNDVIQWQGTTTGKLTAGAGNVVLDANGIYLTGGTATTNKIRWLGNLDGNAGIAIYMNQSGLGLIESYYQAGGSAHGITTSASGRIYIQAYTSGDIGPFVRLLSDSTSLTMGGSTASGKPILTINATNTTLVDSDFVLDDDRHIYLGGANSSAQIYIARDNGSRVWADSTNDSTTSVASIESRRGTTIRIAQYAWSSSFTGQTYFGIDVAGYAGIITPATSAGLSGMLIGNYRNIPLVFGTNDTERARFTGAGILGMGTTTPESGFLMDIHGNLRIGTSTDTTNDSSILTAGDGSSSTNGIVFKPNDNTINRTAAIFMDKSTGYGLRIQSSNTIHIDTTTNGTQLYLQTRNGGRVGIGTGAGVGFPQSTVYVNDTIGGWMQWSGSGIDGTGVTFHADQTGDVGTGCTVVYYVKRSSGGTNGGVMQIDNGATGDIYSSGGNICRITINANGSASIARAGGTGTYAVNMAFLWLV